MRPATLIAASILTLGLLAGMGPQDSTTTARKPAPASPFGQSSPNSKSTPTPATPAPSVRPTVAPKHAEPTQAPLSANGEAASQVVAHFLTRAASGHTYAAVDEYFDIPAFTRLALKDRLSPLDQGQQAYVEQLSSVLFKTLISGANFTEALKDRPVPPLSVAEAGDQVRVTFSAPVSAGERNTTLVLHNTGQGWKIIDMDPVASRTSAGLAKVPAAAEVTPIFMEGVVGGIIASKFKDTDQDRAAGRQDAQQGVLRATLQSLNNQLELYKARTGRYPDLVANGWTEMIKGGYIRKAPVNPVNNSSEVCAGLRGRPNYGWTWNATTGTLGACYFDEKQMSLTPEAP